MLHEQRTMALLFLLSLLLSQTLISSAAAGPELRVKEGEDAVLPCSIPGNIQSTTFEWTKDGKEVFFYEKHGPIGNKRQGQDQQFKGRTSHFQEELSNGNASIQITETKVSDSGEYTCSFLNPTGPTFSLQLVVECILKDRTAEKRAGACPEPHITSFYSINGQAELQCKVNGVSDKVEIEWRDSSDHSLDAVKTQHRREDGSYNTILNATVTKSGTYRCVITQRDICHQVSSPMDVNIRGACPKPSVTSRYHEQDRAELQCEVDGVSDKVEIEWRDSSDHSLDAVKTQHRREDGSYNIILNATVTKSGTYRCVITQRDICHQVYSFTNVNIRGSDGWIITSGVLSLVVLLPSVLFLVVLVLVGLLCRTRTSTKGSGVV